MLVDVFGGGHQTMEVMLEQIEKAGTKVEWCEKLGGNNLRFTFERYLTKAEALNAIEKWREAFRQREGEIINLIWDCTRMQDYDSGARMKWTMALFKMKSQIGTIWLITDSSLIRLGATVMGLATSLNIRTIRSEKDIVY
jgi:hypothetical protein